MNTATMTETLVKSFQIPSENVSALLARVDTLNKKAVKLGLVPIVVELGREIAVFIENVDTGSYNAFYTPVCLTFQPIKVAGNYVFKASVEHEIVDGKHHNMVAGYNLSAEDEKAYRHVESKCEHCCVNRQRNNTYVVKSIDTGNMLQVGSSCLKDFIGVDVAGAIASLQFTAEISSMDDEEEGFGKRCGGFYADNLKEVVEMTVAQINKYGFVSSAKAKEANEFGDFSIRSTATDVNFQLHPPVKLKDDCKLVITEADKVQAAEIIAKWNAELVPALDNGSTDALDGFSYKLAIVTALGYVKQKMHNIVVGSVGFALRKMQEAKTPKLSCNEFFPGLKEGDKFSGLALTVAGLHKFESAYGTVTILRFKDADGRTGVWFASGSVDETFWLVGKAFNLKGTVKALKDDPKYGKQTVLIRCKPM